MNLFICAADLYVHLDDGFPNQSGSKESPEGNQEMATGYSRQVKERIGDLEKQNRKSTAAHGFPSDQY